MGYEQVVLQDITRLTCLVLAFFRRIAGKRQRTANLPLIFQNIGRSAFHYDMQKQNKPLLYRIRFHIAVWILLNGMDAENMNRKQQH